MTQHLTLISFSEALLLSPQNPETSQLYFKICKETNQIKMLIFFLVLTRTVETTAVEKWVRNGLHL